MNTLPPVKNIFLRDRWFWVAMILAAYQAGIFMFDVMNYVVNRYEMQIVPFALTLALEAVLLGWIFATPRSASRRWMLVSAALAATTFVGSLFFGSDGLEAIVMSPTGIMVSYEIVFGEYVESSRALEEYIGLIVIFLTGVAWLALVAFAPRMNVRVLRALGLFLLCSVALSIAGCSQIPFIGGN